MIIEKNSRRSFRIFRKKRANRKITIKTFEARKRYILSWGLDEYLNKYVSVKLSSPGYETYLFFIDFFKKLNI